MRVWRVLLLLVLLAALAAFGWHWVAVDPGYVLVRLRGWRLQTTVVAAVVILLLIWAVLSALWQLLRWPTGALSRRHRRVSQRRLGSGLVALVEGRHAEAERDLQRAARLDTLRGPALLAAAEAASRQGEQARAIASLDEAAQAAPQAARVLRARMLRRDGRPTEALALLAPEADAGRLTPGGWRQLALAALAADEPQRARKALEPLRKSGALGSAGYAALETQVLTAALMACPDGGRLNALWGELPKAQRRIPAVVDVYARRAAGFGLGLAAMGEVESALRREWSPLLVSAYGLLQGAEPEPRLHRAEGWLDAHPDDAALLLTLGRLCVQLRLWGKARQYLERSLALSSSAGAWEALGEVAAAEGDLAQSQRSFRNALILCRGEPLEPNAPVSPAASIDTRAEAIEERDAQGLPRLR